MSESEFSWLDVRPGQHTGLEGRAAVMRSGEFLGKDKTWATDGEYIWLRRAQANPATLERHEKFVASGDYEFVETQDGVEVWQLKPQSQFYAPRRQIDIAQMDNYNVRRQAALAACRRDWTAFRDIMVYLRERINTKFHPAQSELVYTETYAAVMAAVATRNGPSPGEINRELMALAQRKTADRQKIITIGGR